MFTSKNKPLQIFKIQVNSIGGELGISICPGIKDVSTMANRLDRNLEADVKTISTWNAKMALTLMELSELERFGVANIGEVMSRYQIIWHHLPVRDMSIPDTRFEAMWDGISEDLRSIIVCGGNVLIHCRGGLGRSGMITARILVDLGWKPDVAIQMVREVRPGAIETRGQEKFVLTTP